MSLLRVFLCVLAGLAVQLLHPPAQAASFAATFSDAQLNALLRESPRTRKPVQSIAELVPLLPEELRQNFTFVYNSRSPFRASISADFPRVILFSQDATFVATFIGDPARSGHDVLETMTFEAARSAFALRAYVLPAAAERDAAVLERGCPRCHGQDPRPIYDSYPLWPGYYGSVQDTFPPELASGRSEHKNYRHFLATQASRGVYRDLLYIQGSPLSPYTDPGVVPAHRIAAAPETLLYEPNTRFGMALTELNRKRIFRKLTSSERFAAEEQALLFMLLDCEGGAAKLETESALSAAALLENTARLLRLGVDPTVSRQHRFEMQELGQIRNLAQLDQVARRLGVDRSDWSMALEPGSAAFFDGILSERARNKSYYLKEDLIFEFLRHLSQAQPAFAPYFVVRPSFPELGYPFGNKLDIEKARASCQLLRTRRPKLN